VFRVSSCVLITSRFNLSLIGPSPVLLVILEAPGIKCEISRTFEQF